MQPLQFLVSATITRVRLAAPRMDKSGWQMNVHLEVVGVDLLAASEDLSIFWQGQYESKLTSTPHQEIVVFCPTFDDRTVYLNAYLGSSIFRRESLYCEHHFQIAHETTVLELKFDTDETHTKGGMVRLKYRCESVTNPDKVRFQAVNSFLFSLSVDYLNTLFEPPLEAVLHIYNARNVLMTKCFINNTSHTLLLPVIASVGEGGLTIFFTEKIDDREVSRSYKMILSPLQTVIYSLPTTSNKIIVVELNLLRKREAMSAMYHSAVFREGQIVADGPQKARVSLTPRRASSINAGLPFGLSGNLSARHSVAGAVKYVLYLNDESVSVHQDSFRHITEHILPAVALPTKDIAHFNVATDFLHHEISSGRLHGTYLVCSSKSDIVEGAAATNEPKKGKSKRRALQNLCLGLVKLDAAYATAPLKLRATVLKIEFAITSAVTSDGVFDTSSPLTYDQHISVYFSGSIKETSREIFNDTGLMSCTLEGTLLRPDDAAMAAATAAHESVSASGRASNPPSPRREGESCMAFKVYMSLIHGDAANLLPGETELVDDDGGGGDGGGSAVDRIVADDLRRRDEAKATAQRAVADGAAYNATDGSVPGEELRGVSHVNVPAKDGKTLLHELQAQRDAAPAATTTAAATAATDDGDDAHATKPPPSSSVPTLSLEKLQQGSRETLTSTTSSKQSLHAASQHASRVSLHGGGAAGAAAASTHVSESPSRDALLVTALATAEPSSAPAAAAAAPVFSVGVNPQNAKAFADLIRDELAEKQRLIERLLRELDEKYDAIQLCGRDIRQLREEKLQLQGQVKDLQGAVGEGYEAEQRAAAIARDVLATAGGSGSGSDSGVTGGTAALSPATLLRVVDRLHAAVEQAAQREHALQRQLSQRDERVAALQRVEAEFAAARDDFAAQRRFVETMQRDIARIDLFRRTITTQEKMIARLQSLMESKLKSKFTALRAQATRFAFDDDEDGDAGDAGAGRQIAASAAPPHGHHRHQPQHHAHRQHKPPASAASAASASAAEPPPPSDELVARQQSEIIALEDKVRALEDELAQAQRALTAAAAAATAADATSPESDPNGPATDGDGDGDGGDADADADAVDMLGRRPAKMSTLKAANLKIDQLVAETVSKGYRIEALERQMETSAKASAREVASLRTKIFELEMAGAAAAGTTTATDAAFSPKLRDVDYEVTRRESVVDIDRIPTPPGVT
eukprot:gene4187-2986_t